MKYFKLNNYSQRFLFADSKENCCCGFIADKFTLTFTNYFEIGQRYCLLSRYVYMCKKCKTIDDYLNGLSTLVIIKRC